MNLLRFVTRAMLVSSAVCAIVQAPHAWARNPNGTWRLIDTGYPHPSERKHQTMIYDANLGRVIMYGGEREQNGQDVALGDVWVLDFSKCPNWQELVPQPDPTHGYPDVRHGHVAAYVGNPPRMIIFGGRRDFGNPPPTPLLNDAWSLSLTGTPTWTRLSAGPNMIQNRTGCPGAIPNPYNPRSHMSAGMLLGNFVITAGLRNPGNYGMQDTWGLDLISNTWGHYSGATSIAGFDCPNIPERRYWHSSVVDEQARMVVFGGVYEDIVRSNAWYTTNGSQWTNLGDAPESPVDFRRMFHSAVYDAAGDRMVVLGGFTPVSGLIHSEVTSLPLPLDLFPAPEWSLLSPSGTGPGNIAEHAAVYDPVRDWMIAFGGVETNHAANPEILRAPDVWVLDFTDTDTKAPSAAVITGNRGRSTATISWTAPGDDGTAGTATAYDLRKATFYITPGNFLFATPVTTNPPQAACTAECADVVLNQPCTNYTYALRTRDEAGNWSPISNVINMTQFCSGPEVSCGGGGPSAPAEPPQQTPSLVEYALGGSNPTSTMATLLYGIPAELEGQTLEISIFDVAGRLVRMLERGPARSGQFSTSWDLRGTNGDEVGVGVYFARLQLGAEARTLKVVVGTRR